MDNDTLYRKLKEAYSDENLTRITGKLIEYYQNRKYGNIREIANLISDYITINEEKDARCFSKLVILYHPDKGEVLRNAIEKAYLLNNTETLKSYAHILLLKNLENIRVTTIDEDVDYNPVYYWEDVKNEEYYNNTDYDDNSEKEYNNENYENSFYNTIKLRVYGDLDRDFPPYYLEDLEHFELALSNIETLDGIEYCKHAISVDLTNNDISDIAELWNLNRLEELYLANNQIGYIDALGNLLKLRVIDLSGNQIDDISPLFELENLEFVNLIGNPILASQIKILKQKGIIVMH
ncbi:leucine-rich repeat domain-containing protein [Chondrinema litorale]|uniref:leucine-rich repeat domain-containing protein n=1 Tax=Chondrinema litorale TaxID=2994555 RepID=UPI00254290B2|nr:leucine-rich repeat domain-containing protein [Chondrinema litorale]UZR95580.1 leucine-rich repeat domain-containing protein [Chondrinema litorale]